MLRCDFLFRLIVLTALVCSLSSPGVARGNRGEPLARFTFDGHTERTDTNPTQPSLEGDVSFVRGLAGQALRQTSRLTCGVDDLPLDGTDDFSIQFWVRTTVGSDQRMVFVSKKDFRSNSVYSQKRPGWAFFLSHGTWAWSMGSGSRRITYERDNGKIMPVNDGRWHQLVMTFDRDRSVVRLYYDGVERALYNVADSDGFSFANATPLAIGWESSDADRKAPTIEAGAENLQRLVDLFNDLGVDPVEPEELIDLIVDPKRLFDRKVRTKSDRLNANGEGSAAFAESMKSVDLSPIRKVESVLMRSPYTVHQNRGFTSIAPVTELYSLVDGRVTIRDAGVKAVAARERLDAPAFDIDDLAIWDRVLSRDEVRRRYQRHFELVEREQSQQISSVTAAAWNIWHGGKHFTMANDGWDSRSTIAEMIRREGVDLVMMQETYSSGDYIAAELGYYFATGIDWDYINQGSNISVLSRYPIEDVHVPPNATFSNLAVKVALSETQRIYVMSNWYGMNKFESVFEYHKTRFSESDHTPTLFAGDFNAIPHTDGGKSPASRRLLDAGFADAFRERYPNVQTHPGSTHRSGRRIDQLFYKGSSLTNTSTTVVSSWPTGFPSDHFMIVSSFDLGAGDGIEKTND